MQRGSSHRGRDFPGMGRRAEGSETARRREGPQGAGPGMLGPSLLAAPGPKPSAALGTGDRWWLETSSVSWLWSRHWERGRGSPKMTKTGLPQAGSSRT